MHHWGWRTMTLLRLFCGAYLWLFLVAPPQGVEPKDLPTNKGSIIGENTYVNPALKMRVTLPGVWHIFDRTMYSTDEQKRKEKEAEERVTSTCRGALCGHAQIDVALQAPSLPPAGRPQYAIFLLAYELAPEYQNPRLLRGFAETMTLGSMGNQWVPDGELVPMELGGKPAYWLAVHKRNTLTARGCLYVAESNKHVFMLFATAMSEPPKLALAIEAMKFTE
jgi:hypothetical protein